MSLFFSHLLSPLQKLPPTLYYRFISLPLLTISRFLCVPDSLQPIKNGLALRCTSCQDEALDTTFCYGARILRFYGCLWSCFPYSLCDFPCRWLGVFLTSFKTGFRECVLPETIIFLIEVCKCDFFILFFDCVSVSIYKVWFVFHVYGYFFS